MSINYQLPQEHGPHAKGRVNGANRHPSDGPPPEPGIISQRATRVSPVWLRERPPERQWLLQQPDPDTDGETWRGWLPLGKVGLVVAGGGVGKTMALIQLGVAVAVGCEWLGMRVASPGRVLLALAEEDVEEARRRIYYAAHQAGLSDAETERVAERLMVVPLAGCPVSLLERDSNGSPVESKALRDLRALLEAESDWRLVVLDPLARWAGFDAEVSNGEATRFIEVAETLARAPGSPTVLLAHHVTKASKQAGGGRDASAARGSSALVDGARWVANLTPGKIGETATVEMAVTKSNYAAPGDKVTLVREQEGQLRVMTRAELAIALDSVRKARTGDVERQVMELLESGELITSLAGLRQALGLKQTEVARAVTNLEATGRIRRGKQREPWEVLS